MLRTLAVIAFSLVLPAAALAEPPYYVVGQSKLEVGLWAATSDLPESVKLAADKNAADECAGAAERVGDYTVTYEVVASPLLLAIVLVSAHYRCEGTDEL